MIASVTLWSNGMVMVFNEKGEQMTDYQGKFKEKKKAILKATKGQPTKFWIGKWHEGTFESSWEAFKRM